MSNHATIRATEYYPFNTAIRAAFAGTVCATNCMSNCMAHSAPDCPPIDHTVRVPHWTAYRWAVIEAHITAYVSSKWCPAIK